jgi:phage tail sheath gpL-like
VYARIGGGDINLSVTGYYNEDVNLNGTVSYNNAGNDRGIIYVTIGGADINVTVTSQVPN